MDYIAIDETSFCPNDFKKYGYSNKGKEIQKVLKHHHSQRRFSAISAISKDGHLLAIGKPGSIKSADYLYFLTLIVKDYPGKTLLHDNASIHRFKLVKNRAFKNNIKIIYNPPYTPQFNPIELSFSKAKTLFRSLPDHIDMKSNITTCLNSITKEDAFNFFRYTKDIISSYKTN